MEKIIQNKKNQSLHQELSQHDALETLKKYIGKIHGAPMHFLKLDSTTTTSKFLQKNIKSISSIM